MRALSLTALIVLAACGSTIKPPTVGACKTDADCASGQTCNQYGFCQHSLGCHVDTDCGANKSCDADAGTCLCVNDQGCATGETCNASHRCQPIGLCQDNANCPSGKICSTANHLCIDAASCGGTVQCPLGNICDTSRNVCVPGCLSSGDCPQTQVNAQGVTVFAPEGCVNGQCQVGGCTSNAGCKFGQFCANNVCGSDCVSGPYCQACDPSDPSACGGLPNLCLDDPRNNANCMGVGAGCNYWCGVDCSGGAACPSGFVCNQVITVLPGFTCTCGTMCSNGTGACLCNEGDTSGFCACQSDFDCQSVEFPAATCQMGLCVIGNTCFPSQGLYCDNPGPPCP